MTWETVIFYLAAALTVGSALVVTFSRRLINAGFGLLATFGGVAILYGVLGASFLAGAQLLLYIGGVLVLVLFAIVLTRDLEHARISMTGPQKVLGIVVMLITLGLFYFGLRGAVWMHATPSYAGPDPEGIGQLFMGTYILAFEAVSVVLLIALVGAAYMARRRT